MPVEASSLIGKLLNAVWVFPCSPVHSAWENELTLPIATWAAFMELEAQSFVRVDACEIDKNPEKYPSLGLLFVPCAVDALRIVQSDGNIVVATPLSQAAHFLPARIVGAKESDPLREGVTSQCTIELECDSKIIFRHMMPPETLGIGVESAAAGI